ncbi:MAG: hypothetical protein K6C96_04260 [Butyrivibrio sp.]|nr:hypothetical protein [Butyrivibrio sp.]
MRTIIQTLSSYDALIDIISCVFTVLALVFTLYFWLLDHLSEDESKFIEGKEEFLNELRECLKTINNNGEPKALLPIVQKVNNKLEVILNYRFWVRSKKKEDYKKINVFYADSKYLISTIRRYVEAQEAKAGSDSLVGIPALGKEDLDDIQSDYRNGLMYIIDFIESWN